METSTFDPTRAVVFDLARGQVALEGGGGVLLMPTDVMAAACSQLDATLVRQLGAALGKRAGARARPRIAPASATLEAIVEQLGGELSLGGFGALSIERWGQALVARIEGYPLAAQGQELLAGFIEAALLVLTEREVTAFPLERTAQSLRLLLCSRQAATKVKGWLLAGSSWGDALATLQSARRDAGGRH
jgi:hypothetical protein